MLSERTPIVSELSEYRRRERGKFVLMSPRVIAAALDKADHAVLRLIAMNESTVDGCFMSIKTMTKRLKMSERAVERAVARLEALGLIGWAERRRPNGQQTTTSRVVNPQLFLDLGKAEFVLDESFRNPQLEVTFERLPEVGEILEVKLAFGPKNGRKKEAREGVTFASDVQTGDTPRDTPEVGTSKYLPVEHPTGASREQLTTFAVGATGDTESEVVGAWAPPPTTGSDLPIALGDEGSSSSSTSVLSSSEEVPVDIAPEQGDEDLNHGGRIPDELDIFARSRTDAELDRILAEPGASSEKAAALLERVGRRQLRERYPQFVGVAEASS